MPSEHHLRLFLISDLHVDHRQNHDWMHQCLASLSHASEDRLYFDCLLLPGDLCTAEELFEETMRTLTRSFHKVFFCFGNHEAWTRGEKKGSTPASDSLQKLERIHDICQALGVYTTPVRIVGEETLFLLPLWSWYLSPIASFRMRNVGEMASGPYWLEKRVISWTTDISISYMPLRYHSSWDQEPDLPLDLRPPMDPAQRVSDFRLCRWTPLEDKDFIFGPGGSTRLLLSLLVQRQRHMAVQNPARDVQVAIG